MSSTPVTDALRAEPPGLHGDGEYWGLAWAALGWLEKGIDQHASDLAWIGVRPVFDGLRSQDRFLAMCATVGVAPEQKPGEIA